MKRCSTDWKKVALVVVLTLVAAASADAKTRRRHSSTKRVAHAKHRSAAAAAAGVRVTKSHGGTVYTLHGKPAAHHAAASGRHAAQPQMALAAPGWSTDHASVATNPTAPPRDVLNLALQAYACGEAEGDFAQPYLTIIDYSRPSVARRLWVLDVRTRRVLFNELVAHGQNSGENFAVAFSNEPGSRQSSIGLYRTEDVYIGEHGGSLRLMGLEQGFNDLAWERQIVMHGAYYVSDRHIAEYGQLGRSWGCPALAPGASRRIIPRIQGGSAVFVYYPDQDWLSSSRYLHCNTRLAQR